MQFERREPGRHIAAAVRVLRDAGRPLTAWEIAEEAVARGLIRPSPGGASPDATMTSTLKRGPDHMTDVLRGKLFFPASTQDSYNDVPEALTYAKNCSRQLQNAPMWLTFLPQRRGSISSHRVRRSCDRVQLKRHEYGRPVVRLTGRGAAHCTLRTGAGATPDSLEKNARPRPRRIKARKREGAPPQ